MLQRFYDARVLRQVWTESKVFRRLLIIVAIYAGLRLLMQFVLITDPEFFPDDLRIYLDAARDLLHGRNLYPPLPLEKMEFYQYAPSFALTFVAFVWMPNVAAGLLHTVLHVTIYALLYFRWDRLFEQFDMQQARRMLAWTLPVWLVFAAFWNDLAYLNIYLFLALMATLLIKTVLNEQMGWSLLWLSIILQTKPQWAFAVLIPLLLGRYRFFLKLMILAGVIYIATTGVTILAIGPRYGWEQHREYAHLLTGISGGYPWRGPDKPYLGYNHSIAQTMVYAFGINSAALNSAKVIKILLLAPLMIICIRCLLHPPGKAGRELPQFSLDMAFALYTAAFIWLDVVWELSLGIAVFTYLLATTSQRTLRNTLSGVFLLYALVDCWQIISYIVFGDAVIDPGPYVLTDPSIYIPVVMIVAVAFHAVLIRRLWMAAGYVVPQPRGIPDQTLTERV